MAGARASGVGQLLNSSGSVNCIVAWFKSARFVRLESPDRSISLRQHFNSVRLFGSAPVNRAVTAIHVPHSH